jgi:lactoylglutathione lyase
MTIKACHHHGFTVFDLEKSVAFYRDILGLEVVRISERTNLPSYDAMLGFDDVKLQVAILTHPVNAFVLELFQYVNPPSAKRELKNNYIGSSHVAYEVEDVDEVYARMQQAGHDAIHPPVDVVRDGQKVARGMYALDPDGISVELFEEYSDVVKR